MASKVEEVLQSSFSELASIRGVSSSLLRLPNGLQVHVRCELQAHDGHHQIFAMGQPAHEAPLVDTGSGVSQRHGSAQEDTTAVPEPDLAEPASLRDADVGLIARTLKECGGNVSAAARKLRVSRGLIYRRTRGA